MAGESHKRKGKNSYLINCGAKRDGKWKRNLYFRNRDRCQHITRGFSRLYRRWDETSRIRDGVSGNGGAVLLYLSTSICIPHSHFPEKSQLAKFFHTPYRTEIRYFAIRSNRNWRQKHNITHHHAASSPLQHK